MNSTGSQGQKTWSPGLRRAVGYRTEREEVMEAGCVLMLALSRFNKLGMFPASHNPCPSTELQIVKLF